MKIRSNRNITASKLDDLRKQRDEYDAETKRLGDIREEKSKQYRKAIFDAAARLEREISTKIGTTPLQLSIRVSDEWDEGWSVSVEANQANKFSDKVALAWNWSVKFNRNGEIVKDSSSWSGLQAVTADQLADLEESVRVLKILNSIDWYMFLREAKQSKPKYSDFNDEAGAKEYFDRSKNRPNFDEQIQSEQIEALIGSNSALKLKNDQYYKGDCYIIPTNVSDKFVTGHIVPAYVVDGSYNYDGSYHYAPKTKVEIESQYPVRRTSKGNLIVNGDGEYVTVELTE